MPMTQPLPFAEKIRTIKAVKSSKSTKICLISLHKKVRSLLMRYLMKRRKITRSVIVKRKRSKDLSFRDLLKNMAARLINSIMSSKSKKRRSGKSKVTARSPYLKLKMRKCQLTKDRDNQKFTLKKVKSLIKVNKLIKYTVSMSVTKNPRIEMRESSTAQNIIYLQYALYRTKT